MAKYNTLKALFTAIANSLRGKTGGSGKIVADDFPSVIDALSTGGITPTGTKTITSNGSHDVTSFATAQVNVPVGITPSGSKTITANGTHDVTNYASAVVDVPTPEQNMLVFPITLSSALGNGANANHTLLSANDFVKKHYADVGFSALWIPLNATTAAASGIAGPVWVGNRPIFTTKSAYYGVGLRSAGESNAASVILATYKISQNGYNVTLRADSSGNVKLYVASTFTVPAGNYLLVLLYTG